LEQKNQERNQAKGKKVVRKKISMKTLFRPHKGRAKVDGLVGWGTDSGRGGEGQKTLGGGDHPGVQKSDLRRGPKKTTIRAATWRGKRGRGKKTVMVPVCDLWEEKGKKKLAECQFPGVDKGEDSAQKVVIQEEEKKGSGKKKNYEKREDSNRVPGLQKRQGWGGGGEKNEVLG